MIPLAGNFYELFAATAARFSSRVAMEIQRQDRLDSFTFADLSRLAERAAAALVRLGLSQDERCALLGENDAYWCAAYLGALRMGGVAVPLDTAYKPSQFAALLRDSGARVLWTTPRYLATAKESVAFLGGPCDIVLLYGAAPGFASLEEMGKGSDSPTLSPCPARRSDRAVILYTSGTTSDPKGVVLTHGNLLAEAEAVLQVVSVSEVDRVLGVLPLFHALAQMANLLLPLAIGARVVFLESVNTTELLRCLKERDITIFACVPQFFYLIHQRVLGEVRARGWLMRSLFRLLLRGNGALRRTLGLNLGPMLFRRVHEVLGRRMRLLVTGGSRFDSGVEQDFYRLGFNLLQAYGLTECSGAAAVTRPGLPWQGSTGWPLPGVEISILPPAKEGDSQVAEGEVAIRGPIVMAGYLNRPEVNAAVLRNGWLHTGDLGRVGPDGRLYLTGRKKEIIVTSAGKNIYPEEIEAHYLQSSLIKDICIVGLARPGEPAAERLHAVVVADFDALRERKIVNAREIIRFEIEGLSIHLPSHKRVLSFEIWTQDLPRTTTRKLKRFEIERLVRERQATAAEGGVLEQRPLSAADAAWTADPAVARALTIVAEAAKRTGQIHPDANIDLELGLDSMERVELLTRLEQLFGTSVSDEIASRLHTVREMVETVRARPSAALRVEAGGDGWGRLLETEVRSDPEVVELLQPKPLFSLVVFAVLKLLHALAWLLFRFRVSGREHLPRSGPFLLSPNHQSYLDPFLLVMALPYRLFRQVFFVGASEYFQTPFMRRLARLANLVPVDPDSNLVRAMQAGAYGLRQGRVLVLFPEGERTPDGEVKRFKKGAGILSFHLRVPIVPVALEGSYEVWPRGHRPQRLAPVRLRFGKPLSPPRLSASGRESEELYLATTEQLRAAVLELWQALRLGRTKKGTN